MSFLRKLITFRKPTKPEEAKGCAENTRDKSDNDLNDNETAQGSLFFIFTINSCFNRLIVLDIFKRPFKV